MKKRIGAMLLFLCMVLALLTPAASAIDKGTRTVAVGGTIKLIAAGSYPYRWSVDNEQIISWTTEGAHGGICVVRGLRPGTATVTLNCTELVWDPNARADWYGTYGENVIREKQDTWTITVTESGETIINTPVGTPSPVKVGTIGENVAGAISQIGAFGGQAGLVPVKQGDLWGYADAKLNLVIPFQFDSASSFAESKYAVVKIGNLSYVIDSAGEYVISKGRRNLMSGSPGIQVEYDYIYATGKDADGNSVPALIYNPNLVEITGEEYQRGIKAAAKAAGDLSYRAANSVTGKWEYVNRYDTNGGTVLTLTPPSGAVSAGFLREGVHVIKTGDYYGAIDKTGKLVIPCIYNYLANSYGGYLSYQKDGKLGLLENPIQPPAKDTTVTSSTTITIQPVSPVQTPTKDTTTSGGTITIQLKPPVKETDPKVGDNVSKLIEERGSQSSWGGQTAVKINGKWGYVDRNDVLIIPCSFAAGGAFEFCISGKVSLAKVTLFDGKENIINTNGDFVLSENYDSVTLSSAGILYMPNSITAYNLNVDGTKTYFYFDLQGNPVKK